MKRLLVIALIALLSLGAWGVRPAGAATRYPTYKNCTEMHKRYKGGVARVGARDKRPGGGRAKYRPYVNTGLYNANKKSDRDKDGIACEQ